MYKMVQTMGRGAVVVVEEVEEEEEVVEGTVTVSVKDLRSIWQQLHLLAALLVVEEHLLFSQTANQLLPSENPIWTSLGWQNAWELRLPALLPLYPKLAPLVPNLSKFRKLPSPLPTSWTFHPSSSALSSNAHNPRTHLKWNVFI